MAGGALVLVLAPAAAAHVQVTPAVAAPDDAVLFEVLVPNEREQRTTAVTLKVPKDVLPFSFDDQPGWKRSVKLAADGSTDTITWRGRLAADGFARFTFLASTPEREGTLSWKSLQTYADGKIVRWIGDPDSEEPAATTDVRRAAARQNAGGESGTVAPAASEADRASAPAVQSGDDDDRDALTLGLAIAGLALGAGALAVALRRRTGAL